MTFLDEMKKRKQLMEDGVTEQYLILLKSLLVARRQAFLLMDVLESWNART
jgi:hypothetical protein